MAVMSLTLVREYPAGKTRLGGASRGTRGPGAPEAEQTAHHPRKRPENKGAGHSRLDRTVMCVRGQHRHEKAAAERAEHVPEHSAQDPHRDTLAHAVSRYVIRCGVGEGTAPRSTPRSAAQQTGCARAARPTSG